MFGFKTVKESINQSKGMHMHMIGRPGKRTQETRPYGDPNEESGPGGPAETWNPGPGGDTYGAAHGAPRGFHIHVHSRSRGERERERERERGSLEGQRGRHGGGQPLPLFVQRLFCRYSLAGG